MRSAAEAAMPALEPIALVRNPVSQPTHERKSRYDDIVVVTRVTYDIVPTHRDLPREAPQLRFFILPAFGTLIAVGCALRFWKLNGVGLWYDELWNVVGASNRPFMEMIREWVIGDAHPPGYLLFNFAWFRLFPNTEFWSRLPDAAAGSFTILYLLLGTRLVLSRDERIMSASFASLSNLFIFYSLSVKQYSPMILFATIATIAYLRIVATHEVDRRTGITLCVSCVALCYLNHFSMAYSSILLALLIFTFRREHEQRRRILRIATVTAIAYLPIVYFLYLQVAYSIADWQTYDVHAFLSELLPGMFFDDSEHLLWGLGLLFAAMGVALGARDQIRQLVASIRNRHLLAIAAVFCAFMLLLGASKPIFYVRYFLVILPVAFIGLGILMAAAFPLTRASLAIVPLVFFLRAAVVDFHTVDTLQRQQWDKSVDLVLDWKQSNEPVYVLGARPEKTGFQYLQEGNVDGVFYVRNLKFYDYYFRRRGASDIASALQVVEPTVESAAALAEKYRGSGVTVYVLAAHHIQYDDAAFAVLASCTRSMEITPLYSTLIYKLIF